jgi:hypothetical protein
VKIIIGPQHVRELSIFQQKLADIYSIVEDCSVQGCASFAIDCIELTLLAVNEEFNKFNVPVKDACVES